LDRDGLGGGWGQELIVPDTIKTGEPTDIKLIVSAVGGGAIKGRFTDMAFHYKLTGEPAYKILRALPAVLPDNFIVVQSKSFQSEAYKFTIPPYLKGTTGEIEFYTEITFDGFPSRTYGDKKIKVSDEAKSSYTTRE
jgi:hypothetical protein